MACGVFREVVSNITDCRHELLSKRLTDMYFHAGDPVLLLTNRSREKVIKKIYLKILSAVL